MRENLLVVRCCLGFFLKYRPFNLGDFCRFRSGRVERTIVGQIRDQRRQTPVAENPAGHVFVFEQGLEVAWSRQPLGFSQVIDEHPDAVVRNLTPFLQTNEYPAIEDWDRFPISMEVASRLGEIRFRE